MPRADPDRPACPKDCDGSEHTYCRGHTNVWQDCTQWRIKGGKVCKTHGGSAPQVKAAAAERVRVEKVRKMAATYGAPRDVSPDAFLLELVSISAGAVWWLREIISELDPGALVYGEKQTTHQEGHGPEGPVDITTVVHGAGINVWMEMYLAEREHGRKASSDALRAGVEERQIQLAEQFGERAGQWLRASLEGEELSEDVIRRVVAAGIRNMHVLEGAG